LNQTHLNLNADTLKQIIKVYQLAIIINIPLQMYCFGL